MALNKDTYSHHISQQFNDELEDVKSRLLEMGGQAEKQLGDSIHALIEADSALAELVCEKDRKVNRMELDIDEECRRILARRQPAASDLRLVMAISKATTDLERVGDESKRIARLAIQLSETGEAPKGYVEVRHISEKVRQMMHQALDAFARFDVDLALEVAKADKDVDIEYASAIRELITYMMEDPRSIGRVINVIWALRSLERVGDHARNIAEQVIYLVKGTDVRHISYEQMEAKAQS
ncbi:MAG: phosphate signaling complex protein PhoU [Pseudomonadales bacterium]|nr:phosphate signaling complex protein PhoU [Pseudomonadales bacterium]